MSTPLINAYMTDYKSLVLEVCLNPLLPVEMVMAIADCFETPDRGVLHKRVHEASCEWCARFDYHAKCPGKGGEGDLLAMEMFAADEIKWMDTVGRADMGFVYDVDEGDYEVGYEPDDYVYDEHEVMWVEGEDD